jgi:PRTRC genetic system protein A
MNMRDEVLQRSMPSIMAPKFEALQPMETFGERVLVATNGVFLEVSRPWIALVRKIADYDVETAVPYGVVEETTTLRCSGLPADLVQVFVAMARQALPNETAAWIVWNVATEAFRIVVAKLLEHTPDFLSYEPPLLERDEVLVLDCHSHGIAKAFFSPADNRDDRWDVKFALVVGNCDEPVPSLALRLCAKGLIEEVERLPSYLHVTSSVGSMQ